jgi:hypothetical protein
MKKIKLRPVLTGYAFLLMITGYAYVRFESFIDAADYSYDLYIIHSVKSYPICLN